MDKPISDRGVRAIALLLLTILILYIVRLMINNNNLKQTLNNNYSQSFYELVEYSNNVETLLAKAQISSTPEYSAKTFTEIWREANLAENSLAKIPITHVTLTSANKFLNQVSDYSYALSHKTIEDNSLTDEDFNNIKMLYDNCKTLNMTLSTLESDMGNGSLSWEELTKKEKDTELAQEVANISQDNFGNIEKNLQDYEGLIYDGPFSEHMTSPTPKGLGNEQVDKQGAEEVFYQYIDKTEINELNYNGIVEGKIIAHSFTGRYNDGSSVYMDISETGGKVIFISKSREPQYANIDIEEAKRLAQEFLISHGFESMEESYYMTEGNSVTINFAYTQSGVICYPDLIKVKVALDNGEILGMETQGYLNSHTVREFSTPKIDVNEARKLVNQNVEITSERLALIPTDWSTEILVYEFKGRVDDRNFIVYVNADTGKEEDVFLLIESENGILAI
ncbi:MAG: germination protein YpeB [Clostridia bacterium]|nr:germination protein YpeB [Clostridia bacterium]